MPHSFRNWKDYFPSLKKSASGPEPNRSAAIDADEADVGAFPPRQPRRVSKTSGRSRLGARRRRQEEILRPEAKRFLLPDNKFVRECPMSITIRRNGKIIPIYKTFTFAGANRSARPNEWVIMALILKKDVVE